MVWGDFPYQELRNYKIKTSIFDHIQIIFFFLVWQKVLRQLVAINMSGKMFVLLYSHKGLLSIQSTLKNW